MLLEGKTAVVYGAGGAIGAAVARAFAAEGARVALTGPHLESLQVVEAEINRSGADADVAVVDAFDEDGVDAHLKQLVADRGRIDISFNAVGLGYVIGESLVGAASSRFMKSMEMAMRTQFVTAIAAGREMARAGSGVIQTIVAAPARQPMANQGTLGIVGAAIDGFYRQLALDLGPDGVRVICICSAGSTDSPGVQYGLARSAEAAGISPEAFEKQLTAGAALKRLPLLSEIGSVAALMASDHASAVTGTLVNVTCGQIVD